MKKTTLFIAPFGARNKKAAIFEEIVHQYPDSDYSSVLYITPAAFGQTESRRQFFSYLKTTHKKKVYIPFQSFTIKNLCTNLYETYGKENIVSGRIEPLILCEILGEKNIGYARLLSDLLSKIRHYILDKELALIKEDIKSQIFEEKTMRRAVKAIEILEVYEKELKEKGLVDFESALKNSIPLIKEYMNQSTPKSFATGRAEHRTPRPHSLPDGRQAGAKQGGQNTDKGESIPLIKADILVLDGFFDPTPLELEIIATLIEKADTVLAVVEETAEFLKFFEPFAGIEKKRLKSSDKRTSAPYIAYASMEDEVEGIARGVKGLILEGVKPNDITVSFPRLSKYVPMLKRVFQKHGIPVNIAEYDLSASRPLVAVEEMIASIEDDYPRNEFLSFLTSAHFPAIPEIVRQMAVSVSARAGIVKGKKTWLSVRKTIINSIEEKLSRDEKKILNELQRQLKQIITTMEKLRQANDLTDFIDEFEAVLNKFGFFDSLESGDETEGNLRKAVSELKYFAQFYSTGEISFQDAAFYLKQMLKGLKGIDKNADGVRAIPFELAAGLECKALFFGGVIEDDLPSRPPIDPILPEKVKKALNLPYLEYYLGRQKRYFRRLLNVSSSDPYLSCPVADGDKIFLPSPFLDWGESVSPPVLNILTQEDILLREGAFKKRDFSDTLWDGKLPSEKDIKSVFARRFKLKAFFRVTDIDAYRKCPMRFYIEKFLCLKTEKPPEFEVESRLWGKLAHRTMEHLFSDGDVDPETLDEKLFQGLEKSLKEFPIGSFWSGVARKIFANILPALKEQETEIRMQGFSPFKVENTLKAEVGSLRLKGKIDRIDRKVQKSPKSPPEAGKLHTGQAEVRSRKSEHRQQTTDNKRRATDNGQQSTVILLDYKTGSIDKESLQLPLYISIWNKQHDEQVERAGFYSLKDGKVDWYPKKRTDMDEFLDNSLQLAEELVRKMRDGIFEPVPFKDTECRYCTHSALCKNK